MISHTSKSLHKSLQDMTMVSPCSCLLSLSVLLNLFSFFPRQLSDDFGSKDTSLFSGSHLPFSLTLIDGTNINFSSKQTNFFSVISWEISWWQLFVYILHIMPKPVNTFSLINVLLYRIELQKTIIAYTRLIEISVCKLSITDQAYKIWKVRLLLPCSLEVVFSDE